MIKKISIHNYKSFHPTQPTVIEIDTSKPATFIYGLNGAGKSAIGEVIHGCYVNDQTFAHCKVETTGTGPFRHLVYNYAFVSRVIGEPMQGIFTIGEIDTAKQKEIDSKEAENVMLEAELTTLRGCVEAAEKLVTDQVTRGIDEVWKAHVKGRETTLARFLQGYGKDKKKFFNELHDYAVDKGTPLDTMDRLEQRWADVSSTESSKSVPQIDLTGFAEIETDTVWAEPIEVSVTSRLAPLVAKLGNGDWVDQGRVYVKDDQCPFCQQGLPHDFHDELTKLLEGGRKLKIEKINRLVSNYELRLERLQERMGSVFDDSIVKGTGIDLAWAKLEGQMKANLASMRAKQAKPSNSVSIEGSDQEAMTAALATLSARVADFNQRILDRGSERAKIKTMFFQVLCADRAEAYATHEAALAPLKAQLKAEETKLKDVKDRIAANDIHLMELRRLQRGVDASVESINAHLKDLGITSFWIKRKEGDGHLYCLARPNNSDCSSQSLSEGEKTLISFLYFIELIKGSHEESETIDIGKTIVVIDDPISSLSQNFIYDVATIIQHQLVKPSDGMTKVRQVVVLTHNLFFFHELVHQIVGSRLANAYKKCQMLRVQKKGDGYSAVVPLDPESFKNDYDALWQVLRDAKDHNVPVQVVPNTMRCILEQFFAFTAGVDDFEDALDRMAVNDPSHKFKALHRYLDRGSHRDGINGPAMDWSQYDVDYYLGRLRALLTESGHEHHYLRKMGEDKDCL